MLQTSRLTTVMYHYVRPLAGGPFPRLKALEFAEFEAQLDYLSSVYNVVSPAVLSAHLLGGEPIPERPCVLTFDDGYSDHYDYVFPALQARGLSGLFFAPYSSLVGREPLEVNKVQFILAKCPDPQMLAAELDDFLRNSGDVDIAGLRAKYLAPNRFDGPEVAYFKRLLQHALEPEMRSAAINLLFETHVTADVSDFAEGLYLTIEHAREMRAAGNEFGGHGANHLWHALASKEELAAEVAGSVKALEAIGAPVEGGFYCYPFGSHDQDVCRAVANAGFQIGFTVEPKLFPLESGDPLRISRLDTNDLPKSPMVRGDPWLAAARNGKEM